MKNGWKILSFVLIFIIIAYIVYYFYQKKKSENKTVSKRISEDGEWKVLTYRLPTSIDMDISGPEYWKALHNIVDEIPCSLCRNDAIKRMVFFHDSVNAKIGHDIYDMENWKKYLDIMNELRNKYETVNWTQLKKD